MEVDHVIPEHLGGETWDPANLQALCRGCHIQKTRIENTVRTMSPEQRAWLDYKVPGSAGSRDPLSASGKRSSGQS